MTITNLNDLKNFLRGLPEGTTTNILASDLEAGNFEAAHFVKPNGELDVQYTGPVAEGYASPFETQIPDACSCCGKFALVFDEVLSGGDISLCCGNCGDYDTVPAKVWEEWKTFSK